MIGTNCNERLCLLTAVLICEPCTEHNTFCLFIQELSEDMFCGAPPQRQGERGVVNMCLFVATERFVYHFISSVLSASVLCWNVMEAMLRGRVSPRENGCTLNIMSESTFAVIHLPRDPCKLVPGGKPPSAHNEIITGRGCEAVSAVCVCVSRERDRRGGTERTLKECVIYDGWAEDEIQWQASCDVVQACRSFSDTR